MYQNHETHLSMSAQSTRPTSWKLGEAQAWGWNASPQPAPPRGESLASPALVPPPPTFWQCFVWEILGVQSLHWWSCEHWWPCFSKRKTSRGHMIMWYPHGGRDTGWCQQNSDIVLLCVYFLSNYYKNIQNIKNCSWTPSPPAGGGVWCDAPAVKTTAHQMAWLERGQ